MSRGEKIGRLAGSAGIAVALIVVLSVPLGVQIPAIGNLLNPYGGIWNIDHTDPESMDVNIPFLKGDVTVIKDEYGIPHIYADYESDAVALMGWLHARDRLFQLEMVKRQAAGTLSEVVGPDALSVDKKFRNLRIFSAGKNQSEYIKSNDPAFYQLIKNYTTGLNYYINNAKTLPLEFHLLGFQPSIWTPADVLAIEKIMDQMLTFNTGDLQRTLLNNSLVDEGYTNAMDELYPLRLPFQKPISVDHGSWPDENQITPFADGEEQGTIEDTMAAIIAIDEMVNEQAPIPTRQGFGSNNWVVNGSKSATGFPILCNDMHLEWTLPNIWYEAHLVAADTGMNVQGFTLAGTPLVIVGHNEDVAWGLTNAGLDHLDWYHYDANETHYFYDGAWYPFGKVTEEIKVKGQASEQFEIKTTVHGPVYNVGSMVGATSTLFSGNPIAFRWVAIDESNFTTTFQALYGFSHASNVSEFKEALNDWALPSQNIVYADRFNNIGIRCSGWVPFREGITNETLDCRFLVNGSAAEHEWNGSFIPPSDLPQSDNPGQEYLVSANQMSAGPEYPYYLQHSMDTGYRARRINEVLYEDASVSVEDMGALHTDVFDKSAEWFLPIILEVFDNNTAFPSNEKTTLINQSIDLLRTWNNSIDRYKMLANISAPSIFINILMEYQQIIFQDEFSSIIEESYFSFPQISVIENLTLNAPDSQWFNDITTTGTTEQYHACVVEAIKVAISFLSTTEEFSGKNPSDWLYGDMHQIYFHHLSYLGPISAGPYPANGSGFTPSPSFAQPFELGMWGASERMIIDFSGATSNFDTSKMVIPGGSSGNPVSPHYTDQLELFLKGEYHGLYYYSDVATFPAASREGTWTFSGGGN